MSTPRYPALFQVDTRVRLAELAAALGRTVTLDDIPDTLQLDYGNPALQEAMLGELRRIARQCDGVRCDMAMLILPEVFERTWGISAPPFWPRATRAVRGEVSGFLFLAEVYAGLLACLKDPAFRDGDWQLLECRPAWDGNETWKAFVCFSWTGPGDLRRLVAVNYAPHQSQCYVATGWPDLDARIWRLQDRTGPAVYDRAGDDLARQGLYIDMPAWGYHVFAVSVVK
jgi:hypothetical protein